MKLENIRKSRKHNRWIEGLLQKNPVLIQGLALPFAIMVTTSLKNSVTISVLFACSLIPTVLLASLIGNRLPQWLSPILYSLFTMFLAITCLPGVVTIFPEASDALGIYVPILSFNTVLFFLCDRYRDSRHRPILALLDAISYSAGFALAMCLIALIREPLGSNTLWGIPISFPIKLTGLQIAFSGFIVLSLLIALLQFLHRILLYIRYRRANPSHM